MKIIRIVNKNFKDAFKSVFRNFSLSMASVSCTAITLILVSIALLVTYNVNSITEDIEDVLTIVAFVDNKATQDEIDAIDNELSKMENILDYQYNTKDKIKENLSADEDLKQILESLDENPIQSTFVVNVKDIREISKTANNIKNLNKVVSVKY